MAKAVVKTMKERVEEVAAECRVDVSEVKLSKPYDLAGLEVEELYIREPVACDLDHLMVAEGESEMKGIRKMICTLCGVGHDALDLLPAIDYTKLMKKVEPFLDIAR